MGDASWDGGETPEQGGGPPTWATLGLGCGGALLFLLLTCASLAWLGIRKGLATMDQAWAQMRADVELMRTNDGARILYRTNPGLAETYPVEDDFVRAVALWRPRLGDIPPQRPDLKALMRRSSSLSLQRHQWGRRESVSLKFRFPSGDTLVMDTEEQKLVDIRIE